MPIGRLWPAFVFSLVVIMAAGGVLWLAFDDPATLLRENALILPIAIVAAAFANATAVGGGFLFIPLFIFGYGFTATQALKLSLATQAFGMSSGALGWSRECMLPGPLVLACIGGFAGMVLGTHILVAPDLQMKLIFGWVNIAIGLAIFIEMTLAPSSQRSTLENDAWFSRVVFTLLCAGGGLITAWVSIGIGEVVALYLIFVNRVRFDYAIATGVAALALCSILGFALHSGLGDIPWEYLVFTAPGVIIGGRYGAKVGRYFEALVVNRKLSMKGSPLKWLFTGVVLIDGVVMLVQAYFY